MRRYGVHPINHPSNLGSKNYGILDMYLPALAATRLHRRCYTAAEAAQVVDWLNGEDQPLDTMMPAAVDDRAPENVYPERTVHNRLAFY